MKVRRQKKIVEIISQKKIQTQKELADILRLSGFEATQATVSRDVRELGLIKAPSEKNTVRYTLPGTPAPVQSDNRLKRSFKDSVVSLDHSENLIIIKTLPGEAQGVASAVDQAGWPEIVGTIGGDDTILVIAKLKRYLPVLLKRFNQLVRG
ncbi:MAG: Arginine repressor [Desulfotomaculum sp. 46_296]|nr:MAG: Arginine repressor [Desulfotomaculum sp. 46_296]HAU32686.1 arginine repressor [Desulfotomaculum sp.]